MGSETQLPLPSCSTVPAWSQMAHFHSGLPGSRIGGGPKMVHNLSRDHSQLKGCGDVIPEGGQVLL